MDHVDVPGQIALDIDALIREAELDAAPAWTGSPLRLTLDYRTPDEHAAAMQRWILENGQSGCRSRSNMWSPAICHQPLTIESHELHVLSVDLRTEHGHEGPGALLYQANCTPCGWHEVADGENAAVEAMHDHAVPDWRDLPLMPHKISAALSNPTRQSLAAARAWVEQNYPAHRQHPGAPIRTTRTRMGTRHVPGRSPFGGFDLTGEIRE